MLSVLQKAPGAWRLRTGAVCLSKRAASSTTANTPMPAASLSASLRRLARRWAVCPGTFLMGLGPESASPGRLLTSLKPWLASLPETARGVMRQSLPDPFLKIHACNKKSFPTKQSLQELSPRLLHGDLLIHTELGTISPVRLSKPQPLPLVRPRQPDKAAGLGKGGEGGVQQRQVGHLEHGTWIHF